MDAPAAPAPGTTAAAPVRPVRLGLVLLSHSVRPAPSTRIAVTNVLPLLRAAGFESEVVFEPATSAAAPDLQLDAAAIAARGIDLVVFQKVRGPSAAALARGLRAVGVRSVYLVCDIIDAEMTEATDRTVVVTEHLKSLYPPALQPKVRVVHDGIERPEVFKRDWGTHTGSRQRPLEAVLVTSHSLDRLPLIGLPPPWLRVTIVGQYAPRGDRAARWRAVWWRLPQIEGWPMKLAHLRSVAHPRIRREAWHPQEVYDRLLAADVGIIPVDPADDPHPAPGTPPNWQVKSENRLTLMMSAALPVVATPIPSYVPVIEQGVNAFGAWTRPEWIAALAALRDPARRRQVGEAARASVVGRFSQQAQADRLAAVLREALKVDDAGGAAATA